MYFYELFDIGYEVLVHGFLFFLWVKNNEFHIGLRWMCTFARVFSFPFILVYCVCENKTMNLILSINLVSNLVCEWICVFVEYGFLFLGITQYILYWLWGLMNIIVSTNLFLWMHVYGGKINNMIAEYQAWSFYDSPLRHRLWSIKDLEV